MNQCRIRIDASRIPEITLFGFKKLCRRCDDDAISNLLDVPRVFVAGTDSPAQPRLRAVNLQRRLHVLATKRSWCDIRHRSALTITLPHPMDATSATTLP